MLDITAKPSRPLVAPSILASDFARLGEDAADVIAKGADLLHCDVMDGHFVPNLTIGPPLIAKLRAALPDAFLDVHLMVERPGRFIEPFAEAGANLCSFHLEVTSPFHPAGIDGPALIDRIHGLGMAAGMVINPYTPAEPLEPFLEKLDLVLVMSVVPGFGGQAFMPSVLAKTRWLRDRLPGRTRLEMDGGITTGNAAQVVEAGVDTIVAGTAVFGAADRAAAIEAMHEAG